ncbi:Replication protein A DNA-binding subunit E [Nymphaea thermarum]|nr:Replication protein A DNA-binding subunit E [Nymphaea thermarum]
MERAERARRGKEFPQKGVQTKWCSDWVTGAPKADSVPGNAQPYGLPNVADRVGEGPNLGRSSLHSKAEAETEASVTNIASGKNYDSDGGEIRVTCINLVADQFYDRINVGKVYLISKGTMKPAKKNFNHLNNEWEIILESTSTIEPCLDEEDSYIPSQQQFNFRPISEIESMVNNPMVDIIGVVVSVHPPSTIRRKNGTETQKRYLQLKDMSGRSIELTLWGNFCNVEGQRLQEMCDSGMCPVLAVKAGRLSDFNGKSVMTISSSQLFIDPQFLEAQQLTEWFNREGKNVATPSILRDNSMSGRTYVRKTLSQIKDEGLGRAEKPDWITVSTFVWSVNIDNFCYTACPLIVGDRQCKKKVTLNGDGMWHCEKCGKDIP